MNPIYLDHNATTPIAPEVAEAMAECYAAGYVNPASQHEPGRLARRKLEAAREGIAEMLGAKVIGMDADAMIFTSGGTEANNLALLGLAARTREGEAPVREGEAPAEPDQESLAPAPQERRPPTLVISSIEHPSVIGPAEELQRRGWNLERLRVSGDGVIDVDRARDLLCHSPLAPRPSLLSVMLGNNETGVLQPVDEIAKLCRATNILMHTDAVQVAGKLPIDFRRLDVDAMTISAHKFHGPRGIGALVVRHGVELLPIMQGGFQQAGLRPGTEDVALAVGMFTALELWSNDQIALRQRVTALRDSLEHQLRSGDPSIVINGEGPPRLPHTSNIAFPGIDRQAMLMALDVAGVACSTGSACASGSSQPSPVLIAMGCDEDVISSALRFSIGANTTAAEIDEAVRRILLATKGLQREKKAANMA